MERGINILEDSMFQKRGHELLKVSGTIVHSGHRRRASRDTSGEPFGDTEGSVCKGSKVKQASRAREREDTAERVAEITLERHRGCHPARVSRP